MTTFFFFLWLITVVALPIFYHFKQRADRQAAEATSRAEEAMKESERQSVLAWEQSKSATAQAEAESQAVIACAHETLEQKLAELAQDTEAVKKEGETQCAQAWAQSQAAVSYAQQTLEQKLAEISMESDRAREHYEKESLRIYESSSDQLKTALAELAPLRGYASLQDAEIEVRKSLADAIAEAAALRRESQELLDQCRSETSEQRRSTQQRVKETRERANALLDRATRDAGRIAEAAERRAEQIGGDAYIALRDKQVLEDALGALWNEVNGYGDRYVIPTRSLLDDLAEDFGHTDAGEELKTARDQSRRLVELKQAATCKYEEEDRRDRANRFVVDAFNGRVDAILTRTRHDNFGTLEKEMRDAFSVVNLNGLVFREARILPTYLDARLSELKWGVIVQELKLKEREEQREIQERIREEEKARRDYERALQEAAREEAVIKQAMERARAEAESANAEQRARLEAELDELNLRLVNAEAKGQRALSMAQQTRSGNVYVISNVGSFGEGVLKIGMTRRLIPEDRIKELGDASVPFGFDVHAMIRSSDAPALERMLHQAFNDARINKVNYRKEFFRVPLERLRELAEERELKITFTMAAAAQEYRESLALEKMSPAERVKYQFEKEREEVVPYGDSEDDELT